MIKKTTFLIGIYIVISFMFWFSLGLPIMEGDIDFKFYSDSKTYEELALTTDNVMDLIRVSGNQIGPVFICKLIGPTNYTSIFLVNFIVFLIAIKLFLRNENLYRSSFLILIFINPVTFSSLFAINKEIFLFLTLAFLVRFIETKKSRWILLAFVVSLIVRWQLSLFYIVVWLTFSQLNFLKRRRWLYISLFLFAVSAVLSYTRDTIFAEVFYVYEQSKIDKVGGVGLFDKIMGIQDNYGYFFAFVPKVLHLLLGMTTRLGHVFNPDPVEMYNDVVLYWMGPINFFLLTMIFWKRRFKIKDPYVFLALIYTIIFAITPIYNIRYFYPVGILLSFVVFKKQEIEESGSLN